MARPKRPLDETDANVTGPARKVRQLTRTSNVDLESPSLADVENLLSATNAFKTAVANVTNNVQIEVISINDSSEEEDLDDTLETDEEGDIATESDEEDIEEDEDDDGSSEDEDEEIDDVASISSALLPGENIEDYEQSPFDYIRVFRPYWDYEAENFKSKKPIDPDKLRKRFMTDIKGFKYNRRAVLQPEHKWVMMRDSWRLLTESLNDVEKRCPDNFGMYIYNDFWGYGLLEVIENFLSQYSTAFNRTIGKKNPEAVIEKSHKEMWLVVSALGQFLNWGQMNPFMMIDDGERFTATVDLLARAILSAVNSLDRAGHLEKGSEYKDIGFVIGTWYNALEQFEDLASLNLHENLLAYMKKGDIDVGIVFGTNAAVEASNAQLPKNPGLDTWKFAKHFKEHKAEYGRSRTILAGPIYLGGDAYDITKWPSEERARYAFDGKDPMKDAPER